MELNVYSEIGKLKSVLLHRPGRELENLTPDTLEELLFDDIPYLEIAQKEHDEFSGLLRAKGIEVYYLKDEVSKVVEQFPEAKEEFIETFVKEAIANNSAIRERERATELLTNFLKNYSSSYEMVAHSIAGVRISEIEGSESVVAENCFLLANPLPNLYFQRDPFSSIGNGISLNKMHTGTRNRETLYAHILFKYSPLFENVPRWYDRDYETEIEGGDTLVLTDETLAIGLSQRTKLASVKKLATNLFESRGNSFKQILALSIGESRKFMHLDTVFTQIDFDKYSVHPEVIHQNLEVTVISRKGGELTEEKFVGNLVNLLEKYTGVKGVRLIPCGGDDMIAAAREQWNDGANTLAIAPGEVIVYNRNPVTNELLKRAGIDVNIISSAELSRGRGGPRCMAMPLIREKL